MRNEERRLNDALHSSRIDLQTVQNEIALSNIARDKEEKCAHRKHLVHLKLAQTRQIFIQNLAQREMKSSLRIARLND